MPFQSVGRSLDRVAQFIAVCSAYIRAATLGYAVSFSSLWHGKRRIFERCKPLLKDQLQSSTNADTLSEPDQVLEDALRSHGVSHACREYGTRRSPLLLIPWVTNAT
jgi:hypothetical protein